MFRQELFMKSRSTVLLAASFIIIGFLFSSCDKKGPEKTPEGTSKTVEAMEKFESIGSDPAPGSTVKAIDEISSRLPEVVATVNGKDITNEPVKGALERFKVQAAHQKQALRKEQLNKIIDQILEMEIQREILFQMGNKLEIKVSDEDTNKIIDQLKSRHSTEKDFTDELNKRGFSYDALKKEVYRNVMVSKVIQKEVHDKIVITDQEAMDFYKKNETSFKIPETVHAAHILVKVTKDMTEEDENKARKKIEDVLIKAKAGEDFAELAKKHSEGPSASRGGDLSIISRGQMVKEFEEATFKLKKGGISDIVKTQFGFHIIKAYDKTESSGSRPFEEVKKDILDHLVRSRTEEKTRIFIKEIQKKAEIKRFI